MRSHASGCDRCSHDSFVAVNAATGTLPTASAQGSAPSSCSISQSASGADSVSFHSLAGCTGSSSASSATMPCCCPATLIASILDRSVPESCPTPGSTPPGTPAHQLRGSCSLTGGVTAGCAPPRHRRSPRCRGRGSRPWWIASMSRRRRRRTPTRRYWAPTSVGSTIHSAVEAVVEDDVDQRFALHRAVAPLGYAERDAGRQRHLVGDRQQLAQFRLDAEVPHRQGAAVAERPRGEQQVLAGGVHRRPLVR
jgi:hypothetical protein